MRLKNLKKKLKTLRDRIEKDSRIDKLVDDSIPTDPVEFATKLFSFKPTPYQERLLRDKSKRIAVRFSRQSGKTTVIALRAIWYASIHPKTLTLIVSPSMRQSMIMMDRIQNFLLNLPDSLRERIVSKTGVRRTTIRFRNGSQIVALPCSIHLLRGYTAHQVLVDEAAFIKDDETLIYSVIYPMLATTDGILVLSSTPWSKNSVFYKACSDPSYSKHIATWRDVVEAGLVKQEFIEEMRRVIPPERFKREFETEFIEDEDSYLPQNLIAKCIDPELEYYDPQSKPRGIFYSGLDLGKHRDHSVIAIVEKVEEHLKLVHCHRFPLETSYTTIIGYMRNLCNLWSDIIAVYVDQTGVGEYIVEDMRSIGIPVEGVTLTIQRKEEILGYLKQAMIEGRLSIPYDPDLIVEMNSEKFSLTKDGHILFTHSSGSHDDMLWALALAVYASKEGIPSISKSRRVLYNLRRMFR